MSKFNDKGFFLSQPANAAEVSRQKPTLNAD